MGKHLDYCSLALKEARSVEGRTSPNPPVGAVVVKDALVLGTGGTQTPPGMHAEKVALAQAGDAAKGADLFVTMEPCTFFGQTSPCTDLIIKAGINRVYFIAKDPDPRIGKGAQSVLKEAGISCEELPYLKEEVADLILPFFCRVTYKRPLVTAKYAMTLDGRIATITRQSKWISGEASRNLVQELRDRVDAILTGVGTVLEDNPEFTSRIQNPSRPTQNPLRVILDTYGRTPLDSKVLSPSTPGHTLLAVSEANEQWLSSVRERDIQVETFPLDQHGRVSVRSVLDYLSKIGVNHVLCEGGSAVLGSLSALGLIDQIYAFIAPKIFGGSVAIGPIGDPGIKSPLDASQYFIKSVEQIEEDVLIKAIRSDLELTVKELL